MNCTAFYSLRCLLMGAIVGVAATSSLAAKPTPPPTPPVNYGITWLIAPGQNDGAYIYNVNGQGTTAAGSIYAGGVSQAVTIDVATGNVTDLNTVVPGIPSGWHLTSARGITDLGRIAGEAIDNLGSRVLYVYDPADASRPFQPVGVGVGNPIRYRDMNDAGDLLFAEFGSSNSYLYKHDDQQTVALPTALMQAGQSFTAGPASINNDRLIAGNRAGLSLTTAYVYNFDSNSTTNIAKNFRSVEISNTGTVVGLGSLSTKGSPTQTAMKYANGVKTPLVNNLNSEASGINDAEQVVGRINPAAGSSIPTAFLYDPSQGFWSLNDLIQDTSQDEAYWNNGSTYYASMSVQGMSEPTSGGYPVIVGDKTVPGTMFADGIDRHLGFILTPISGGALSALAAGPVPEPSTALLLVAGILALSLRRRAVRESADKNWFSFGLPKHERKRCHVP